MSESWTDEEFEHAKRLGCHTFNKPFKADKFKKWLDACENQLGPNRKLSDLPFSRARVLSYWGAARRKWKKKAVDNS